MSKDDKPEVPRLPRGRGLKLSWVQIVRIAMVAMMLVAVIVLQKPCSEAVARFVNSFDPPPAAPLVPLRPNMTEEEIRRAVDQARGKSGPDAQAPAPSWDAGP